ncbi:hypothetical protein [Nocardioides marmoribigeumensis]|uniref:Uncharacterized protein n=1 Tax=Nocardioides marmoribigeumensis TaxID=433649 RepID=A0ABU2BY47_9ACTN|nr:hypothetical protein [Nocardioides marmoribigeumensis]MDR7363322.1 hypothetical protein [Nocardioides marmoribigeumensis]
MTATTVDRPPTLSRTTSLLADRVTCGLAVLVGAAALLGLIVPDVYTGPAATAETLRAWDLVGVPLSVALLVAAWRSARGSAGARLVEVAVVASLVYTSAFYVFGTGFNDLFLLHVAVLGTALVALGLHVAALADPSDPARSALRVGEARHPRLAAGLLVALAVGLGAMWVVAAVVQAVDGTVPVGSRLVETVTVVRLGMALDLLLLVPLYLASGVLLWRGAAWGRVLTVVSVLSGLVHQVDYLVAMPMQVAAGVEGAVSSDAAEPVVVLAYLVAGWALLRPASGRSSSSSASSRLAA